jgi:hypothetical protein
VGRTKLLLDADVLIGALDGSDRIIIALAGCSPNGATNKTLARSAS